MLDTANPYAVNHLPAYQADDTARRSFIRKTYLHLGLAVLALVAIETAIFTFVPAATIAPLVRRMGGMGWLVVLAAFFGVSWLARYWASSDTSKLTQYAGLSLYVLAEAVILLPLLYVAVQFGGAEVPVAAGGITAIVFVLLTAYVMFTGVDLAGWGKYLAIGGFAALGIIVVSIFTGWSLGVFFSGAMIALAAGYILYDTSNIMHHYRTDQHVAASLALFASVVLLFWYVLRLMMSLQNQD